MYLLGVLALNSGKRAQSLSKDFRQQREICVGQFVTQYGKMAADRSFLVVGSTFTNFLCNTKQLTTKTRWQAIQACT